MISHWLLLPDSDLRLLTEAWRLAHQFWQHVTCTGVYLVAAAVLAIGILSPRVFPLPKWAKGVAIGCPVMLFGLVPIFFGVLLTVLEGLGFLGLLLGGALVVVGFAAIWFGGRRLLAGIRPKEPAIEPPADGSVQPPTARAD